MGRGNESGRAIDFARVERNQVLYFSFVWLESVGRTRIYVRMDK